MNKEIFTMPSAQDVPLDPMDTEDIELQEVRRVVREVLLREKSLEDIVKTPSQEEAPPGVNLNPYYQPPLDYMYNKATSDYRRKMKSQWNQNADQSFFQDPKNLYVYHKLGLFSGKRSLKDYFPLRQIEIGKIPGIDFPSKNEMNCFGIVNPTEDQMSMLRTNEFGVFRDEFFTFKKYRITLASLYDLGTELMSLASAIDYEKFKSSGLPKRPPANTPHKYFPLDLEGIGDRRILQDVVIDNWVIDTYYCREENMAYAKKIGLKCEKI